MELRRIAARLSELGSQEVAALVTVVSTSGSTYRRAGARLLVTGAGRTGMLSGGCLEPDLERLGHEVAEGGCTRLETFDMRGNDEALLGWGLGCNGVLEVLVQPVRIADPLAVALRRVCEGEEWVVAAALGSSDGMHPGATLGGTLVVAPDGSGQGTLGDPAADTAAMAAAAGWDGPRVRELHTDAGVWRVFAQRLRPPPRLLLCGAGDDVTPLAHAADALGWRLAVVDHRRHALDPGRFPAGTRLVRVSEGTPEVAALADEQTVAVVMSHNLARDSDYLAALLGTDVAYIGVLGPAARLRRLFDDLETVPGREGLTDRSRDRVHGPAGLDLGAESPEEVAVSILAEALAVLRERAGDKLRERPGPIHSVPARG